MIVTFSPTLLDITLTGLDIPGEGVIIDRGTLTPGELVKLTIKGNSVVDSILGTNGFEEVHLWRDSRANSFIDLGDGNDELYIGSYSLDTSAPPAAQPLPASIQGGGGIDRLTVDIRDGVGFDGSGTSGFETLRLNLDPYHTGEPASGRSATVSNISGVQQIVVDSLAMQSTSLYSISAQTVYFSNINLPAAELVNDHVGTRLDLASTVTLGSIRSTLPVTVGPGGWWLRGQEINIVSAASVLGNVAMSARADYFDGRLGSVGGHILGFDGNDQVWGGENADYIDGGSGADILNGMGGADQIYGGDGDDVLSGGAGADLLNGGAGYDIADYGSVSSGVTVDMADPSGGTGDAAGDTFAGIEAIKGSTLDDTLRGDAAINHLYGQDGNDTLEGRAGDDKLWGGNGNDVLRGDAGNDVLNGGLGADQLDGGADFDYAAYADSTAAVVVDLGNPAANTGEAAGDSYLSVEGLIGSAYGDTLRGTANTNWIYGGDGADLIEGGGGDDTLIGEGGNDYIYGGLGNDMLYGGSGTNMLDGGGGFDFANFNDSYGVRIDLTNNANNGLSAIGDVLVGIEGVIGTDANDTIGGDGNDNWLYGGNGNDSLSGLDGFDFLIGGNGADVLNGGNGGDTLYGEAGTDTLNGDAGVDVLFGGDDADILNGGDDNDHLIGGMGADTLNGGAGFDFAHYLGAGAGVIVDLASPAGNTADAAGDSYVSVEGIVGTGFDDLILGDAGANWLYGSSGSDFLYGRDGNDYLLGGDGVDYLFGGAGVDVLYGEAGADRFVIDGNAGIDYVMDFQVGSGDALYLDAASLGVSSFADVQARMVQSGGDTLIGFSANAIVVVVGVAPSQLTAGDFMFG